MEYWDADVYKEIKRLKMIFFQLRISLHCLGMGFGNTGYDFHPKVVVLGYELDLVLNILFDIGPQ